MNTYHYSIEDIQAIVESEEVKVVSFDIFDTLLVRPSMVPTDIFYLLENEVQAEYGLSFVDLRLHAEEEMKRSDATLIDIWNWIGRNRRIDLKKCNDLMEKELALEARLLSPRTEMVGVLRNAKNAGKRIIAVSDMYIPGKNLLTILRQKGITEIDEIYVSCDLHARKDTGHLFEYVAKTEKIEKLCHMVHIGDNFISDYKTPLEKGITAIYYPSIWEDAFGKGGAWADVFGKEIISNPYERLMCSYAVFYTYLKNGRKLGEKRCFGNLKEVASLFLGNVLLGISLDLINRKCIREQYDRISFAARDGYLPKKVYDVIAEGDGLPSSYFQASRQALSYTTFTDYLDYFTKMPWNTVFVPYKLEDFIRYSIVDSKLAGRIIADIKPDEKKVDIPKETLKAYRILKRYKKELNKYFANQAQYAREYYDKQFPEDQKRYLVFDCGYSGSISQGLMCTKPNTARKFDKYYVWQTESNKEKDRENDTKTYCLSPNEDFAGINLILEECFSPLKGSCIGFSKKGNHVSCVHECFNPDADMRLALSTIHRCCEAYAIEFKKLFGPYLKCFSALNWDRFIQIGIHGFLKSPYMELSLLKPIRFVDSLNGGIPIELSKKVYDSFEITGKYSTPLQGTHFQNPDTILKTTQKIETKLRICIHLHLHYSYLLEEFICYLKEFPVKFDLIITTTNPESNGTIRTLSKKLLPNLVRIMVINVENRGRDVAPWLVSTKPYQADYDLFCHLHGKASTEYDDGVGDNWRRYLFDNLIECHSAAEIIESFEENEEIGCIFPKYYSYIGNLCTSLNIPLIGEFGEKEMIEALMQKMQINRLFSRDDLLYSCGTMLWYRPDALKLLFDLGLTTESFPEEPIPNGGTIAHAIERMPGLVCSSQGYTTVMYNRPSTSVEISRSPVPVPGIQTGNDFNNAGNVGNSTQLWPVRVGNRDYINNLRGQKLKWYIKKAIKAIAPYGAIRIWQRVRYKS